MTADPQTPARFRATELQYRWLEPPPETPGNPKSTRAEPAAAPKKTSVTVPAVPHLIDPWQQWAWQPAVFWRTSDDEAFEIPFRAPEELSELLEFEYVLSDAAAIDALVRQLDVATLKAMARLAEQDDPTRPVVQGELVARPPLLAELQRHPGLLQRLEAPMANVPWNVYVVQPNELTAWTDDLTAPLVPRSLKPLMLAADDAVSDALSALQARIQDALLAIERIAVDFLTTTLDSGLNVIYTEALRYFDFETHSGITAAFEAYKAPMAKAVDAAGASKAAIPTLPLAQWPRRLIETLKALQPFAQSVLDEKARLDATPS
ncbi:MAG: hypothetical protein HY020_18315, partial [Burkholderiales bacterium]|nr:hypothetical protein [Burkholderiales bacterium]